MNLVPQEQDSQMWCNGYKRENVEVQGSNLDDVPKGNCTARLNLSKGGKVAGNSLLILADGCCGKCDI